jgi:hypothetical protein
MTRRTHRILSLVTIVGVAVLGIAIARDAHADLHPKAIKALKKQLIVSEGPVDHAGTPKEQVAAFKGAKLKEVKGTPNDEDVLTWSFHYTAFLKKKGFTKVSFEFHRDGQYVADQRLDGVDPSLTVLEGDITINEDEGPTRGKKYTLKLVGHKGKSEVVLAQTTLVLN